MAKNLPTPANAISFSEKNRSDWLGKVFTDKDFTKSEVLIAMRISEQIRYQHGYSGWVITANPRSVRKSFLADGITVSEERIKLVYTKLYDNNYIRPFKRKPKEYYFTDPTK